MANALQLKGCPS